MHELSIVRGIVDIANGAVSNYDDPLVKEIHLEIGELAGIEPSALDFAWEAGTRGTVLENSERHIDHIEGKGKCSVCNAEFAMHNVFDPCPTCNSYLNHILKGKELRVKSLIVN